MVDPMLFEHLQAKIDEDSQLRQELRDVVQILERQGRNTLSILSRAHSVPQASREPQHCPIVVRIANIPRSRRDTSRRLAFNQGAGPDY